MILYNSRVPKVVYNVNLGGKMKKILFVVHTMQMGGAEKVMLNLLKKINKQKYSVTILALVNDGTYVEQLKEIEGIKYKYLFNAYFKKSRNNKQSKYYKISNNIMKLIWKYYILGIKYFPKQLYKKVIKEKYDIEVAFLEGKVSKFIANSYNQESKKIAWIHTDINNVTKNQVFKNIEEEKKTYKSFDKIICVSEEVKKRFTEKTGITNNLYVQVNPINTEEILEKAKEDITDKLNNNGIIVSTVGRLVKEKGYDRLLKVHNKLIKEGIKHTLWIIGDGEERKKLEAYIKENNLSHTVNLVGYTDNPYKYVQKSDIFVCSSRIEGLSSALIEATVLEKPIVTTKCPGIKEILGEDGQTAIIVPNTESGLYRGLKTILKDENLRNKLSQNIKNRSNIFNIDNVILQIENILDE